LPLPAEVLATGGARTATNFPRKEKAMSKLNKAANVNEGRADWAKAAIDTFRNASGTDADDAIGDLIVDLLHLGRRSVKNFNAKPFLDGNLQRFQIEESQEGGRVAYVGIKAFDANDA
jgi:hypothetical protein